MQILLTGCAGFIGSASVAEFISKGFSVVGLDNLNDYYNVDLKKTRLRKLIDKREFSFFECDISKRGHIEKILKDFKFDAAIHLAAQAGVRIGYNFNYKYTESNIDGFINMVNYCVNNDISNFIYASSSSVYGKNSSKEFNETNEHLNPTSYYGLTKMMNELIAKHYSILQGIKCRGLRFFTVYGPFGRPDMAYFRIIDSLINGKPFKLLGDGHAKRDFTFIDDVSTVISALTLDLIQKDTSFYDVVNVGGGNPYSINDVIFELENLFKKKLIILRDVTNPLDVPYTCASSKYLEDLIGFKPSIDLKTGLRMVYDWVSEDNMKSKISNWASSSI